MMSVTCFASVSTTISRTVCSVAGWTLARRRPSQDTPVRTAMMAHVVTTGRPLDALTVLGVAVGALGAVATYGIVKAVE